MTARIGTRLESLSRAALLEIATRGCERDAATLLLAEQHLSEENPLPSWCVEKVLMAQDLIPKIFATVPTCDGVGVAATCRTWNSEWREELRRRKLPLRLTNSICPLLTLPAWPIQGPEERAEFDPRCLRHVLEICALPDGDFVVIVDDTGYSTEAGYIINVGGMYRMLLCTPEFGIQRQIEQWFEKDDGADSYGLLLVSPCVMECDGETLYVLEESTDKIYSYNATDLTPRRRSAAKMAEELAVATDRIFTNHRDYKGIRVVDKETLELRDQIISEDAHFHDMAVLDDLLFANETWWGPDEDQYECRAIVYVFSLEGERLRRVEMDNVWDIGWIAAAHGRLYVIEAASNFTSEDAPPQAKREAGKRVLVLSPALEIVHTLPLAHNSWPMSMTVHAETLFVMDDTEDAEHLCTGRVIEMGPES